MGTTLAQEALHRAEAAAIDIKAGVRTVNEVRHERGLDPLPDPSADTLTATLTATSCCVPHPQGPCPACGYCPCCGRGRPSGTYIPYVQPYVYPWYQYPNTGITWTSCGANSGNTMMGTVTTTFS